MDCSASSLLTAVFLVVICLLTYLYILATSTFDYWKIRGIKFINPLPLVGNSLNLFLRKNTPVQEQQKTYRAFPGERFVGLFTFRQPTLMVRDPTMISDILTSNFSHFHDRDKPLDEKLHPMATNVASLSGVKWKNLRKKLTPVFTSGKLKTMLDEITNCAEDLSAFLEETLAAGDVVDMREIMSRFTMNVIGSIAFGLKLNTLQDPQSEFIKQGKKVFKLSYRRTIGIMLSALSPKILKLLPLKTNTGEVFNFYFDVVKRTVAFREENNIQRNDYLQLLMNVRKEDAKKIGNLEEGEVIMDDTVMAANVFVFFVAGFETTAATLSNCLLELAANPEVQDKLRDEILSTSQTNAKLTYEVIKDMKYLQKVISETLRKYPVAITLNRICTQKYKVPGTDTVLDAGVKVVVPVYSIHTDPQYYPDPDRFDPERFSEENNQSRQNGTYLPFGDGPRICIGLRFALLEMKLALVHVLTRFHFSMTDKMKYPLEFSKDVFLLAPKDGIWLKVTKIRQ